LAERILLLTNQLALFTSLNEVANQNSWFVNNTVLPQEALRTVKEQHISAVVWDLNSLEFQLSLTVLTQIRELVHGPIIALFNSLNSNMRDSLYEIHIDDFCSMPVDFNHIMKIIKQRTWVYQQIPNDTDQESMSAPDEPDISHLVRFHDLTIDKNHYSVMKDGADLNLTPKEFKLFKYLVNHPNQVLSRDQLLEGVWGYDIMGTSRMVDIHISHLRDKIEADPKNPIWIKTVRGFGYIFSDN